MDGPDDAPMPEAWQAQFTLWRIPIDAHLARVAAPLRPAYVGFVQDMVLALADVTFALSALIPPDAWGEWRERAFTAAQQCASAAAAEAAPGSLAGDVALGRHGNGAERRAALERLAATVSGGIRVHSWRTARAIREGLDRGEESRAVYDQRKHEYLLLGVQDALRELTEWRRKRFGESRGRQWADIEPRTLLLLDQLGLAPAGLAGRDEGYFAAWLADRAKAAAAAMIDDDYPQPATRPVDTVSDLLLSRKTAEMREIGALVTATRCDEAERYRSRLGEGGRLSAQETRLLDALIELGGGQGRRQPTLADAARRIGMDSKTAATHWGRIKRKARPH